jgi:hypothetical protein
MGEVPERPNGTVSKTVVGLVPTVGSNPTLSARFTRYAGRLLSAACKQALPHMERGFYLLFYLLSFK